MISESEKESNVDENGSTVLMEVRQHVSLQL